MPTDGLVLQNLMVEDLMEKLENRCVCNFNVQLISTDA